MVASRIHRAHLRGGIRRVAESQRAQPRAHPLDDLVVHRFVQQQPAGRAAGLPRPGEVHAAHRHLDHPVEVGVGEHDERVLAAEFQRHQLDAAFGGGALDREARSDRAREADASHHRMAHQRVADWHARPVDEVDDAGGKAFLANLAEQRATQRAGLGRLQHHGVAGHQRRGKMCRGEQERVVERHDAGDHAPGLAQREMQSLRRRGHGLALDLAREPREVLEVGRGDLHVGAELADGVAGIARLEREDPRSLRADPGRETPQRRGPLPDRARRPARLCAPRGVHGAPHVFDARHGGAAQGALVRRILRLEPLAARTDDAFAADQHPSLEESRVTHGASSPRAAVPTGRV